MYTIHRGPYLQRGRGMGVQRGKGIGSFFASLFKRAVPALKAMGSKILGSSITQNVGKTLAHSALQGGLNIASDTLGGKNFKDSFSSNVNQAKQEMAKTLRKEADARKPPLKRKEVSTIRSSKHVRKKKKPRKSVFEDDAESSEAD